MPNGLCGSISHKGLVAVGFGARCQGVHVGVDIEALSSERRGVTTRALTESEREALAGLPASQRRRRVATTFAVKEAIFKAIDPLLRRPVGFSEAALSFEGDVVVVHHRFEQGGRRLAVDASVRCVEQFIIAFVTSLVEGR